MGFRLHLRAYVFFPVLLLSAAAVSAQVTLLSTTNAGTASGTSTAVAYDDKHDVYLQVWLDNNALSGRFIAFDGTPAGDVFSIATPVIGSMSSPNVTYTRGTADDVFAVVYQDVSGSGASGDTYLQLLKYTGSGATGGSFVGSAQNVSPAAHYGQSGADVVFNPTTRRLVVAWGEARGDSTFPNRDVFVRQFDTTGTAVSDAVNVTSQSQGVALRFLRLSLDWQQNRLIALYIHNFGVSGGSASQWVLNGKLLDGTTGTPLGSAISYDSWINSGPSAVDATYLPERGGFLPIWDYGTTGSQLYAQFTPSDPAIAPDAKQTLLIGSGWTSAAVRAGGLAYDAQTRRVLATGSRACSVTCAEADGLVLDGNGRNASAPKTLAAADWQGTRVVASRDGQVAVVHITGNVAYLERYALPQASTPGRMFTATLTGTQQVPPVVSPGTGLGTVVLNATEDQITVNLSFSGLTSAATAGHVHGPAAAGVNAGVLFDFSSVVPAATSGSIPPQTFPITAAQVADLKAGLYYFNIHSANFSDGEIRGQIAPPAVQFMTTLSGVQQVPPVSSPGTGTGLVALNAAEDRLIVDLSFSGLTSAATAAHIHGPGAVGVNAGVLFDFSSVVPAATSGSIPQQTFPISAAQVAELKSGLYYFNIHTMNFGGGEIRGQIGSPVIDTQPSNQTVTAGQDASFTVVASGAPAPTYQWQVSTGGSAFADLTNAAPYSGATTATLTITATPGALNGNRYRVVVTNSAGSVGSNFATLTVNVPPAPPGFLTATPAGFTRIDLSWNAPSWATSYTIKRSTTPGAETTLATGVTALNYTDTAVAKGQTYYYVVVAVNAYGASGNSAEASATTLSRVAPVDFDGDGKSDLTWVENRTSPVVWGTLQSHAGSTDVQWGLAGDVPVPGDYDGDGIVDRAVYRPSNGTWYVLLSSSGLTTSVVTSLGLSTDTPVPGDYDGDGKTDPAVYRPSTGMWYVLKSSTGATTPTPIQWGLPGDVPLAADYDGDGQVDPAIYRPWSGTWFVLKSSTGLSTYATFALGVSMDRPVPGDYDGDGKADPAVYRPSSGMWLRLNSGAGYAQTMSLWGLAGDVPVPADYNGDGKIDLAVYRRSSGKWYVLTASGTREATFGHSPPLPIVAASQPRSDARRTSDLDVDGSADPTVFRPSTGQWFTLTSSSTYTASVITQWGLPGDVPVPGDYDGDGKADRAVYRPATGEWYVLTSTSGYTAFFIVQWGLSTDTPVPGDYDGDGATDLAVYRPATGEWFIRTSGSGFAASQVIQWGLPGDTPVANDYDGDGKTDPAIYRPSSGAWYALTSSSNFTTATVVQWGLSDDIAVPGDYDGDGRGDLAVYRPSTGQWYVLTSGSSYTTNQVVQWGLPGDLVVPLDYDGDGKTDLAVYRPGEGMWYVLTSGSSYTAFFTRQWGLSTDVPIGKR